MGRLKGGSMAAEYVAGAADQEAIGLGGISPSWLANQLDELGVVRLRDVFSDEWLEAMRKEEERQRRQK